VTAVDEQDVWSAPVPQDTNAEAAALGSVLLSSTALGDVAGMLTPADFYRPAHQLIYAACLALFERGEPVDPITVSTELGPDLMKVGGAPYLHQLMASPPSPLSGSWYAQIVADKAVARRLLVAGERIAQLARSATDPQDALSEADRAVREAGGSATASVARPLSEWVDPVIEDLDAGKPRPGIVSGYIELDKYLNPMTGGQLVVVGGRPSTGKSLVGLDLARYCSFKLGELALFVSLEMSGQETTLRVLAAEGKVDLGRLIRRDLGEEEWERIAHARDRMMAAPLLIDDAETHTLSSLRALIRRTRPALVVLDYLQLITTPRTDARYRQNAVAELSRGLKLLAKSEDVPVVVLCQLNRQPEARTGGRPQLADLRESGAIEQDADAVILIHRPDLLEPENRPGEVDLIVAKQRNGPTGIATLIAQTHYARFVDSTTRMKGW
jgi:replicative DNA helicase